MRTIRRDIKMSRLGRKSKDHRTFEVVSEVAIRDHTQGASAVGVRVPGVPVEMAGEKNPVLKIALKQANTHHVNNGTKLELKRFSDVFELLEQIRSLMDKGVKTEQPK